MTFQAFFLGNKLDEKCQKSLKCRVWERQIQRSLTYSYRLSSGKDGVSFFHEGPQTLDAALRILGPGKLAHVRVAGRLVESVGMCVDRCLAQAHPVGWQRGGAACRLQGGLNRCAVGYRLVGQTFRRAAPSFSASTTIRLALAGPNQLFIAMRSYESDDCPCQWWAGGQI